MPSPSDDPTPTPDPTPVVTPDPTPVPDPVYVLLEVSWPSATSLPTCCDINTISGFDNAFWYCDSSSGLNRRPEVDASGTGVTFFLWSNIEDDTGIRAIDRADLATAVSNLEANDSEGSVDQSESSDFNKLVLASANSVFVSLALVLAALLVFA